MARDRVAERAIRDLAHDAGRAVLAVQTELEIPNDRPAREMTWPEFIAEGARRARVLGEANDRLAQDRSDAAYEAASRAQVSFDDLIGEHLMGGLFREAF